MVKVAIEEVIAAEFCQDRLAPVVEAYEDEKARILADMDQIESEINILGSSLKSTTDEPLFLELALRGYDLLTLRSDADENENTAEIVKIG